MIEWLGDVTIFTQAAFFGHSNFSELFSRLPSSGLMVGLRPHMLENAEITPTQGLSVLCKQFFLEVIKNVT